MPTTEQQLMDDIWGELIRAVNDRHHAWRTPVLATVDVNGFPQARTVVLRGANRSANELRFFTDARTPKCQQLQARSRASVAFWSKRLNWQLRVSLELEVVTDGPEISEAWQRLHASKAATDYLAPVAPGSALTHQQPLEFPQQVTIDTVHKLAILKGQVMDIDWLELSRQGHRRASIQDQQLQWLVP